MHERVHSRHRAEPPRRAEMRGSREISTRESNRINVREGRTIIPIRGDVENSERRGGGEARQK